MSEFMEISVSPDGSSRETALLTSRDGESAFFEEDGNILNNSAGLQSTANSALGINGAGPSPFAGLNSFYGSWTQQIDLGVSRSFRLT